MAEATVMHPRPVLVLHAPADESFVRGYLLSALGAGALDVAGVVGTVDVPLLEAKAPVAAGPEANATGGRALAAIDVRDLATVDVAELERALEACGLMIAVISPAFLADPWSRLSELLASGAAVERDLDMIPLVLESCPLPLHIREKVWLDFRFRGEWDAQAQRLRDHLARPAPVEAPLPCPYPGMRPFEAADARYFHGRGREIEAMVALVGAGEREIYVVGPSGSGKSSLIAAGVVPRLAARPGAAELIVRAMRPGDAPVARLAACLEATTADAAAITAWATRHPDAQLLVVIDQLEEMFTVASVAEQARFAEALRALRAEPRCVLVLAIRADFYAELMQSQLWLDGVRRHVDLPPLRGAALREAIERPARALDVYLERDLVERLLADAAGAPAVLPLMQETLVQLWSRRRRRRLLTVVEYDALGEGGRSGLAVAISSRAERCLSELTGSQVVIARRLLLRLVSFGEGRPNTRRRQTRIQLGSGEAPAELEAVLRHLVAARLLAMDGDRTEDDQVDLCHDVLITAWPAFATWVETRRADELRRRQIQASAEEWLARGRSVSGLLDEGELAAAITWRETDAARELGESPEVTALVTASRDAVTRARTRRRRTIAGVVGGLSVFAVVAGVAAVVARNERDRAETERGKAEIERGKAETERGKAETERGKAERALRGNLLENGRQAVVDGEFQRAIPYLAAARQPGVEDVALRMLFRIATTSWVATSLLHHGPVVSASFSTDGRKVVTASRDGTARLWDSASGTELSTLVHDRAVSYAAVRADGLRVLTISDDNCARVWNVTTRPPTAVVMRHAKRINTAVFSSNGDLVVTASNDQSTRLWSAATGAPVGPPLQHGAPVTSAEINRDASRIVTTVSEGATGALWDAQTGMQVALLQQSAWTLPAGSNLHTEHIWSAAFTADGMYVLTASSDKTARVWNASTGRPSGLSVQLGAEINHARFSPSGAQLATAGQDGLVTIRNVKNARAPALVLEHSSPVFHVEYNGAGTQILTLCDDGMVRVWDTSTGALVNTIDLEFGVADASFSPDGARIVTASADGLAREWYLRPMTPRVLASGTELVGAAYSRDGAQIAAADLNGIRVWSSAGALELNMMLLDDVRSVPCDDAGQRFAVIDQNGVTLLGPRNSPALVVPRPRGGEPIESTRALALNGPSAFLLRSLEAFDPTWRCFATPGEPNIGSSQRPNLPLAPQIMHDAQVEMVAFSRDGRRVVTASRDGSARVWDASSGSPVGTVLAHPIGVWVWSAQFSPDGMRIVTTANDYRVRIWDMLSGRLQHELAGHAAEIASATFSPDGARLLTSSYDRTAQLWSVATGELVVPPFRHAAEVQAASFSSDGARVVTASRTLVQVWDAQTGRLLAPPFRHPHFVSTAVFSPDQGSVLTAAKDAVRIWDVGLDTRSFDDWRRIARDSTYPQLMKAMAPDQLGGGRLDVGQPDGARPAPRQP